MSYHSVDSFALLRRCETAGMSVQVIGGSNLHVAPAALLTDELRADLRAHKPELLKLLWPHVNDQGDLVIPFMAPARFHYWNGGQSIAETLGELSAPALDPELFARHRPQDVSQFVEPIAQMRERWRRLQSGLYVRPSGANKGRKKK
jgi:hypothetical protein